MAGNIEGCAENKKPLKVIKEGSRVDRFCKEYINNGKNIAQAVANAGYNARNKSRTGVAILKRPEVLQHIATLEREMKAVLQKDKPTFLLELRELAERCRLKGRLSEEIKIKMLEADILGITTPDTAQQINVFGSLERLERVISGQKEVIDITQVAAEKEVTETSSHN